MAFDIIVLFTAVSFFYIISPGPAIFLAISNGMSKNMNVVALSSLGNMLGLFCLSVISIVGLGSIIMASAKFFLIIKIIGAAYLIYLGLTQLRASQHFSRPELLSKLTVQRSSHAYFIEGFILASTNPKAILFFIAIFPQFLNLERALAPQFFIMTAIFMSISFLSLFSYGFLGKSAKAIFSNRIGMKWFHRITGGLFIGMGVGLLQLKNAQN